MRLHPMRCETCNKLNTENCANYQRLVILGTQDDYDESMKTVMLVSDRLGLPCHNTSSITEAWAITDPDENILVNFIGPDPEDLQADFQFEKPKDWKTFYKDGYRCVHVQVYVVTE